MRLSGSRENLTTDEREHVREAVGAYDAETARATMKLGVAFNGFVLILAPFLAPPLYLPVALSGAALCFTVDLLFVLVLSRLRWFRAEVLVFVFNPVLIGTFLYCLGVAFKISDTNSEIKLASTLMALSPILIVLSPFSGILSPLMALCFWLVAGLCLPWTPLAHQFLVMYAVTVGFATLVRFRIGSGLQTQMLFEYRARQSEVKAAQAKLQRDLELAREIQDSMAPTPVSQTPEGLSVHCVQLKFEKIAGDWMTTRRFSDGTFVMMIADATGKGMQAALVVHAIQSLWATAMDDPVFEPDIWLERLNRALTRLGEKQPHSATVGIATLKDSRITYWSAGHLPLFLLMGSGDSVTCKTLSSRGNVLGLGNDLALKMQYIDVLPSYPLRLILCSDGVLEHGSMTPRGELLRLYDGMKTAGAAHLAQLPAADDKTLIIVERNVTHEDDKQSA